MNDIMDAIDNFKESGAKYFLLTSFLEDEKYQFSNEIKVGEHRNIDFTKAPFGLPKPIFYIHEGFYKDTIALWEFEQIKYYNHARIKPIPSMHPKYASFEEFSKSPDYQELLKLYQEVKANQK